MEQLLLKLIEQLNSSVFILFIILAIVMLVIYRIGGWTEKFKNQDDKITGIQNISEKVIELKTKVDLIYQFTNPQRPVMSQSPLSLTLIGTQIVDEIEANKILDKYILKLTKEVERSNPKNAYDIQIASMNVVKSEMIKLLNEEELILVKQEAYSKGLLVEDIMSVFGILLRDHILAEKKMTISEVDKHANS